jgi:hypothetical protein
MAYSFLGPEKFQNENYRKISEALLRFAKDDKTRAIIQGILEQGGIEEYSVNGFSELMNRWNIFVETRRRISMAYLVSQYPETFDCIRAGKIGLFHGTSASALPGMLRVGLRSFGRLRDDGEEIISGEKATMEYRTRTHSDRFISMTDDMWTALEYSFYENKGEGFGVVVGINEEALKKLQTLRVRSDCIEAGIREIIPTNLISFLGVPANRVALVNKMVGDKPISVMPMPLQMEDLFFSLDESRKSHY